MTDDLRDQRDALIRKFREATAEWKTARIADGWTDEEGWGDPPGDRTASDHARRRADDLYREIQAVEHAITQRQEEEKAKAEAASEPSLPRVPSLTVQLTGEDGDAFAIVGRVSEALRLHGVPADVISEFRREAMSGDYGNVLVTCMKWVNVI